jgi:tRNA threonylcarbamoyladenosine biosynthesis protein TsaE
MPELFHFSSPDETILFAQRFARCLKPNDLILLTGDLGAGKTTFVKGIAQGLGSSDLIQSPTYVYLQIYEANIPIFHFDLYRIRQESDFLAMGFEEYFTKNGVTLIEWPERISSLPLSHAFHVRLSVISENERTVLISKGIS